MQSLITLFHRRCFVPRSAGAAFAVILASQVLAQTTPPANRAASDAEKDKTEKDGSIELSPFVVNEERDTGYAATDSLAGTRLRTPLKDIAASVSVITKDFLNDIGATNS